MTTLYDRFQPYRRVNHDGEYDAIFIGGGAAGRFGSAYLRAMGGRQLILERGDHLGGSCCKENCVPHHYFFDLAYEMDLLRTVGGRLSLPRMEGKADIREHVLGFQKAREAIYDFMFFQSKEQLDIEFILHAEPEILDPHTVRLGNEVFRTRNLIFATGMRPKEPPFPGGHKKGVINHRKLVELEWDWDIDRMVVIGGGATMAVYASYFNAAGCKTTVVNRSPIFKELDGEVKQYVVDMMKLRGIDIIESAEILSIEGQDRVTGVRIREKGVEKVIPCDTVFLAIGLEANSAEAAALGVQLNPNGTIAVDEYLETNVPHVYAVGDVIDGPKEMWHARRTGMVAARNAMGVRTPFRQNLYAKTLHTTYEVTWLGLTEEEARQQYDDIVIIRMPPFERNIPLPAAERSILYAALDPERSGFQKAIIDNRSRRILGLHHVGYGAKDAFQYLSVLMERGLTIDDMADMNELFLNPEHFIQLCRLRAGARVLQNL